MIISASRRTDIPAFFGGWFMERLREGRVLVKNPMNPAQVSVVSLVPENVDCFVFWTKDPENFLPCLDELDCSGAKYYFQFTVTAYDNSLERNLRDKAGIIETFIRLSERLGKERLVWRYDPVIINGRYSAAFHEQAFGILCEKLRAYTERCVISFIDAYGFLSKDFAENGIRELSPRDCESLAEKLGSIAGDFRLPLFSCCEKINLEKYGIRPSQCIDYTLVRRVSGREIAYKKDRGQRGECGCTVSRDIGTYNTCGHGCVYCYARRGPPAFPDKYGP